VTTGLELYDLIAPSLTHTHTYSHSHTHTHALTHSHTLTHTHTHTHTHSHSLEEEEQAAAHQLHLQAELHVAVEQPQQLGHVGERQHQQGHLQLTGEWNRQPGRRVVNTQAGRPMSFKGEEPRLTWTGPSLWRPGRSAPAAGGTQTPSRQRLHHHDDED